MKIITVTSCDNCPYVSLDNILCPKVNRDIPLYKMAKISIPEDCPLEDAE